MTFAEYVVSLQEFVAANPDASRMSVVFHGVDGDCVSGRTEICIDSTCSEEEPEVVRISMVDEQEAMEVLENT